MTEFRARLVCVVTSYFLIAAGVGLLIRADVGVTPYDVLNTGSAHALGIRVGVAFVLVAATTYAIGIALGGRAGWASLVGTIVIAPLIEVSLAVIPDVEAMAVRVPMYVAGVLTLCFAVCLAITSELGAGPGEVAMLGLVARGLPVARARWLVDGIAAVVGTLLGGALGIGTIVFALGFGPMVAAGLRLLRYHPPGLVVADAPSRDDDVALVDGRSRRRIGTDGVTRSG